MYIHICYVYTYMLYICNAIYICIQYIYYDVSVEDADVCVKNEFYLRTYMYAVYICINVCIICSIYMYMYILYLYMYIHVYIIYLYVSIRQHTSAYVTSA